MRKILVFNNVSLDGMFSDADGSLGWAKHDGDELTEYVKESRGNITTYLFGKSTYQMFASFWAVETPRSALQLMAAVDPESRTVV